MPVALEQLTIPVEEAVTLTFAIVQYPETSPVCCVPVCPTLNPVAVVEASVVAPVTVTVLPNVAASSALNVPAVVMFVLMVVTAPTSVAPSVMPPRTERTEKAMCLRVFLKDIMIKNSRN